MWNDRRFRFAVGLVTLLAAAGAAAVALLACGVQVSPSEREGRPPQLLFLGRPSPEAEVRQLSVAPLDGSPVRRLTDQPLGVWDYAVHPQGEAIVYSVQREDGGTDLWRMERDGGRQRLLLACPGAACLSPAWSPDGRLLAYERRGLGRDGPDLDPEASRIWLFDLDKRRERPLFDYDVPTHSPVWGPQSERLAYLSPLLPGVEVFDLRSEELQQFGNEWGAPPVWSPDGRSLVVPELLFAGEALVVHLFRVDLDSEEAADLSGEAPVKDSSLAWSPAGEWLAFGRQFLDEERWTPGRQIWLVRPDGGEARALLEDAIADHFALAWRPDGEALAYVRNDLSEGPQPTPDVSVWILDVVTQQRVFVADDAVLPKWLP